MVVTWSDLSIIYDFFADSCTIKDKNKKIELPPYLKKFLIDDMEDNNLDNLMCRTLQEDLQG